MHSAPAPHRFFYVGRRWLATPLVLRMSGQWGQKGPKGSSGPCVEDSSGPRGSYYIAYVS